MTTPAAGPSQVPWWVMQADVVAHGQPQYTAVQSPTRPKDTAISSVAAGPFPTEAAAKAWIAAQQAPDFPSLPNPLSFLSALGNIGHWAGIIVAALTDIHLYVSLGWLFLGFILVISGIILWMMKYTDAGSVTELGAALA